MKEKKYCCSISRNIGKYFAEPDIGDGLCVENVSWEEVALVMQFANTFGFDVAIQEVTDNG